MIAVPHTHLMCVLDACVAFCTLTHTYDRKNISCSLSIDSNILLQLISFLQLFMSSKNAVSFDCIETAFVFLDEHEKSEICS